MEGVVTTCEGDDVIPGISESGDPLLVPGHTGNNTLLVHAGTRTKTIDQNPQ